MNNYILDGQMVQLGVVRQGLGCKAPWNLWYLSVHWPFRRECSGPQEHKVFPKVKNFFMEMKDF